MFTIIRRPLSAAAVIAAFIFTFPAAHAALNDTGQTECRDGFNLVACDAAVAGDMGTYPRQDGRFGRDAAAGVNRLPKVGGGVAGFDFTKISNSGAELADTAVLGTGPNDWACTRDNVTGLIWEVKTTDSGLRHNTHTYGWGSTTPAGGSCTDVSPCTTNNYIAAVNTGTGLCGAHDWRLPTRRELLSIVHYGASSPTIDTVYFPNTQGSYYWSSDIYVPAISSRSAWNVYFFNGSSYANYVGNSHHARLVRGGQ